MVSNEVWHGGERAVAGAGGPVVRPTGSAVSWAAVLAGAAAAAALSLILLLLGAGLGLSAASPWAGEGAGAKTIGIAGIVWLAVTQLAASGVGGYLAGRLRVRWRDTDPDEVHFRDTAHGLLAWAVATLFTAAVLTASVGAIVGIGAKGVSAVAGAATTAATATAAGAAAGSQLQAGGQGDRTASDPLGRNDLGYYVDTLLRSSPSATGTAATGATPPTGANPATLRAWPDASMVHADGNSSAELNRLLLRALRDGGSLSPDDSRYAAQLVAQRTGLSQADAERRVTDTLQRARAEAQALETKAREAADAARKTALQTALWMVVALLIGAFTASLLATFGGRQRDRIE
ncbi:hypothetical protein CDN99_04420 [Roseateles aquatilis]|uniref:Transmembrane protein n=1 Tax=Roseateles aquatilis TaxID=431061 RepID=A0A246JM69_9BURK|nr:hypothetical protein [Roseateles aquatilis]OWQ93702.1 hypothetical protein CDN99_04420 [Roseateles aquatilis]